MSHVLNIMYLQASAVCTGAPLDCMGASQCCVLCSFVLEHVCRVVLASKNSVNMSQLKVFLQGCIRLFSVNWSFSHCIYLKHESYVLKLSHMQVTVPIRKQARLMALSNAQKYYHVQVNCQ